MTQEAQMQLAAKLMKLSMEQVQEYGAGVRGRSPIAKKAESRSFLPFEFWRKGRRRNNSGKRCVLSERSTARRRITDRGNRWYGAICRVCHRI